jgi:hypothetical protein
MCRVTSRPAARQPDSSARRSPDQARRNRPVGEDRERDRTQADEVWTSACGEGRRMVRLPFVTIVVAEKAEAGVLDKAITSRRRFPYLDCASLTE